MYTAETVLDSDNADLTDRESVGDVKQGLATGNDDRFFRSFWETQSQLEDYTPIAKGGTDAWLLPRIDKTVLWAETGTEVKRYGGSRPQNTQHYFTEGVAFNSRKRSGRNFGYMHPYSVFSHVGTAIFPDNMDAWPLIGYLNSRLMTYLKLAQTFERKWEVSTVARLPVINAVFENEDELAEAAKEQVANVISKRTTDFTSPHFSGSLLGQMVGYEKSHVEDHPHRSLLEEVPWSPPPTVDSAASISEISERAETHLRNIDQSLEQIASETDELLFDSLNLSAEERTEILQEVGLRTIDDPLTNKEDDENANYDSEKSDSEGLVKDFLLQVSLGAVHEVDDGIVPISDVEDETDLLDHIEARFERIWDDHADTRLAEVDQILGSQTADEEAYPNLRQWLEDDLFEYHVSKFDRTPILWRFTTERLVSDSEGEGFACLVDYHQLDANVFDRLQNRYLEPRKGLLRERRSAANRRRSDSSLSASEQSEAAAEYARCESGLEQIAVFEDRLADLAQSDPRDWPDESQERATEAAEKVAYFREQTAERLETLDQLAELDDVDMEDLFSPSFYETVQENREEWIDALEDLETAFEAYAEDGSEPVEAHLYDLFEYYEDLVGSSHYASNGILFTTYYFEKFEDAGQSEIGSGGISDRERLAAELANDLDDYKALAEDITEACEDIAGDISSEWSDRALSEITTAGYQPNHKHGVEINITPLAEAEIVPKTVDEKVL